MQLASVWSVVLLVSTFEGESTHLLLLDRRPVICMIAEAVPPGFIWCLYA